MKHEFTPLQLFIRSQGFGMTVTEFSDALKTWGHEPCPFGLAAQRIAERMPDATPEEQITNLMAVWEGVYRSYWMDRIPSKAQKYIDGDALFE